MRVRYDDEVDAAYIRRRRSCFGGDEIVGIEILNASARFPIRTLHTRHFVSG